MKTREEGLLALLLLLTVSCVQAQYIPQRCGVGDFRCTSNNMCIKASSRCDRVFDCPNKEDEQNCACTDDEFKCANDGSCIELRKRCDGVNNCDDSSDEADCASACPPDLFSCPGPELHCVQRCNYIPECPGGEDENDCEECNHKCDGRCLEDSRICNSYPDCSDGSDELNCDTCDTAHDFRCQNGECLNIEQRCNGLVECDDSSDEENCTETITAEPHTCAEDQFECYNRICIDKSFHCDGNYDCADNSDELNCGCGEGRFKCLSGQCIRRALYCDGISDCDDGSDENDCVPEPEPEPEPQPEPNPVTEWNPNLVPNTDRYPDLNPLPVEPNPIDYNTTPYPFLPPIYTTTTTRSPPIYTTRGPYTNTPGYRPQDFRPGYPESDDTLKLRTYPNEQTIRKVRYLSGGDIVFTCRDEGPLRAQVRWARQDGRPLPPDSIDRRGRLELYHVTERDSGVYVCQAPSYMPRADAEIAVTLNVVTDQENEDRPFTVCEAYEATCGNGQCIPKSAVCDGKIDCSDKSDEDSCNLGGKCEPNTFQCANKKCVLKTWLCDSEDDCGDGSDEDNCGQSQYGDSCRPVEFACHNNSQCVPKSFHCDGQSDCLDKSDELGCTPVYVTMPPKPANLRLQIGETLTLRCTAVGVPTPLISWRLNWGHVPEKCTTTNNNGDGTLTCPDMQIEDRGAYSCEAINNRGSSFAQPDAIVFVEGGPTSEVCPRGYFNSEAQTESDCIQCFCFGESTQCHSADLFIYNMPTPLGEGGTKLVGVAQTYNGDVQLDTHPITDRYYYQPLLNGATVTKIETYGARGSNSHPYLTLPESYNDNQLTSYGGYIRYKLTPHYQAYDNYNNGVPDIIIKGKYVTLVYTRRPDNAREVKIEARLVPGDWQKASSRGLTQATREDIMMSLDQIEMVLLRADSNDAGVNITDFVMESAQNINSGLGAASLVEECVCPPGYGGLSCQKCLDGYVRDGSSNWLGNCVPEPKECPPGTYGDPNSGYACRPCPCPLTNRENQFARTCSLGPRGVVCDCQVGYEGDHCERCAPGYEGNPMIRGDSCRPARRDNCNRAGTEQVLPNGECICKPNVQGRYCDQCAANSFHLSADNSLGCTQCFCTAETNKCTSSNLRRKKTTASFNVPSIVDEVRLYNSAPTGLAGVVRYNAPVETAIHPRLYQGNIFAEVDLSKPTVYYWSMPAIFGGDKLTSYGGYLTYILRNVPTNYNPGDAADVQLISDNHIKLNSFGNFAPSSDGILNATVRITEDSWQRTDGKEVSRPHFLLALADVKTILIKATYANQMASIVSASIDTAEANGGGPQAVEVEQCACPVGFIGTSCEDCAPGYTRSSIHRGLYLEKCEPCSCNNKSRNCHPETGVCYDCADNTDGDKCERCRFGYERDAYFRCVPSRPQPQCECDPRGTQSPCDPSSPYCSCKQNVEGERCDRCRAGTFGLDGANPRGCSPCYCSGVTSDCHAGSQYSRIAIPAPVIGEDYGGFRLMSLNDDVPISKQYVPAVDQSELMYIFWGRRPEQDLYWSLPDFSGNRVLSYGGNLEYKLKYETGGYPERVTTHDNVVLVGEYRSLSWTSPDPMTSGQSEVFKVPLREDKWVAMESGAPVTRHEFMDVLKNVRRVLVKATVSENIASTAIADVSLDTATDKFALDGRPATDIEICMCPEGHTGTSCETCASGYYADEQGYCKRCRCNGFECQLTSSGEVTCNCPPQFTGPDCSTVVDETTTPGPEPSTEPPPPPPPTLVVEISHPTIRILEVGSSVNFTCRAQSIMTSSRIPVTWSKVDGYLPLGRSVVDAMSGVLIITNLQISDSGVYRCQANDGVNTQTAEVTVKVPGNPMIAPVVQIEPSVQDVYVGERVQLLCVATGNPTPTISWQRAGNRALPVGFMAYGDYLIIDNAQEDDSGEYRCVATNLAGFRDATAMVTIHPRSGPPEPPGKLSVSSTSPNVFEGQSTRVVCTGTANIPAGAIGWTRQDGTTFDSNVRSENGVLYIDVARLTNEGVYVCQAAAPNTPPIPVLVTVQALNPSVEPTTNITVPVTSLSIPTGETGSVDCIPSGYPLPVISWTKYNDEMGSSTTQRDNTLIIANAQESDAGYYLCNGLVDGEPKKSVYVYVSIEKREIPTVDIYPKETEHTVRIDSVYELQCRVSGNPEPVITWHRSDNRPLTQNTQITDDNRILRFEKVDVNDEGEYTCTAENSAGSRSASALIRVRSIPVITITPQEFIEAVYGEPVTAECRASGYPQPMVSIRLLNGYTDLVPPGPGIAVLRIGSSRESDEGTYLCKATNGADEITNTFEVRVNRGDNYGGGERPDEGNGDNNNYSTEGPRPNGPITLIALVGQDASIRCDANDGSEIHWRRMDRQLPSKATENGNELIIPNASKSDTGTYACVLFNRYTGVQKVVTTELRVVAAPSTKLVPPNKTWNPGQSPSVECQVEGDDIRSVTWRSVGKPMSRRAEVRDNFLIFHDIQPEDAGIYECIAISDYGNATGTAEVFVNGTRPEAESLIAIDNPPRAYVVGEDLTLTCRASSRDTSISWEKLGTNEYVQTRDYSGGSVLVIKGVQETDAGVYRCTGRNGYRESFYDYRLEVQPASGGGSSYPDNDNEVRTISARLRDSIDLPCMHDVSGPVAYEWRREPTALPAELRTDEQTLHLETISENDAGTYTCRVTGVGNNNRYASAQARLVLHVKAVVPQFGGDSWLELPTIKDAYRQFNVEISFKPTDYNGLLLYNSENQGRFGDYIALRLVDGIPQFIMNTTMSPDGRGAVPVVVYGDRPLELNVWHTARINRIDSKVSMAIDNTGLFANESREQWEVLDLNQPLYMGGVPDYEQLPGELARSTGFVGCVSMLILGKEEKNIMLDSTDKYQVSDCDNCAPNPCINNGICQEARNELGYICLCPAGYPGRNCDRTGESCRAGLCGEGKCTDTADGYKCSCPITYTGKNCEHQQYIEFPAFTGSAFLAIKAPKPGRMLRVSMKIKPSAPVTDGIIMYCAESPLGLGGFTSLTVRDGRLEFRYDVGDGTGPAIVTAERRLAANELSEVHISRLGPNVTMKINSVEEINSTLASRDKALNLDTPMFVGGVDDSITLNKNIGVMGGFYGCIIDVRVYGNLVDLVNSSIMSANVQDCSNYDRGDIPESESICKLCRNGGQCTPDGGACACRPGFAGRYCETQQSVAQPCANQPCRNGGTCRPSRDPRISYTCDCPLHYTGPQCNQPLELLYSLGLNGNGYLELPARLLQYNQVDETPVVIAMAFNTRDDGLLFYQRETETDTYTGDYLMLRVEDGFVTLDWDVGSGSTKLRQDSVYVTDGNRHSLVAILNHDSTVSLQVDGLARNGSAVGISSYMNADSNIYIGGMPSVYNVYSYHGFTGCIEQIELNSEHNRQLNLGAEAVAGKNIQQCTN